MLKHVQNPVSSVPVTIVSFSAAIYPVPDPVIKVFHERFVTYNLDYSRGLQTLIVKQFRTVPVEQWPALAAEMDKEFQPLHIILTRNDDTEFTPDERERLQRGENVVRIGDWGWRTLAVTPLNEQMVVEMVVPPDPTDVSWLYWSINVLIGATMLACLLLWLRPHWRDTERLKSTAERFGKGHLSERTQISPAPTSAAWPTCSTPWPATSKTCSTSSATCSTPCPTNCARR